MFDVIEKAVPYIYVILACIIVAVLWTVFYNREYVIFTFSKSKSYRKLRGKGREIICVNGEVGANYVGKNAHVTFTFGNKLEVIDTVENFGKYKLGMNEAKLMYINGELKMICFDVEVLTSALHKYFMYQFRNVALTVIGVYGIWNMLLRM